MLIEVDELFRLVMYLVLIVAIPLLSFELYMLLRRLNTILQDLKVVSSEISEFSEDKESVQKFTQEVGSYVANDVIDQQTAKLSQKIGKGISRLLIK